MKTLDDSTKCVLGTAIPPSAQTIPGTIELYDHETVIDKLRKLWQKIKEKLNFT